MTNSSSVQAWTLRMPAGSLQQWLFTFTTTAPGGNVPYPITGATWEYVVRQTTDTGSGSPVFSITPSVTANGALTVTASTAVSSVQLNMYPAATATLPLGTYAQALWMNPGTNTAFAWFTGELIVVGNPQP